MKQATGKKNMSSTKRDTQKAAAQKFFKKVLLPLSSLLRMRGKSFFQCAPDSSVTSYFEEPFQSWMTKGDFEKPAVESVEEFAKKMADLWAMEGHSEMVEVTPRIASLAKKMALQEEQGSEVSPFIYVLY